MDRHSGMPLSRYGGRTVVIENHFLFGPITPSPGQGVNDEPFGRTMVEVSLGRDGKPTMCTIVENDSDDATDACGSAMAQSQGFGPVPEHLPLPRFRYLTVMFTRR